MATSRKEVFALSSTLPVGVNTFRFNSNEAGLFEILPIYAIIVQVEAGGLVACMSSLGWHTAGRTLGKSCK